MSSVRKMHLGSRASGAGTVVVLVDPFWLGNMTLSRATITQIEKHVQPLGGLLRVIWYVDAYSKDMEGIDLKHTAVRVLGRDDLEDGFELIKAIDADFDHLSANGTVETIVLASLDDRLLLSVERAKQRGCRVIGLLSSDSKNDEGTVRMVRQFDDSIQLNHINAEAERDMGPDEEAQLNQVVADWLPTQEDSVIEYIRQYTSSRPGIPREVDSRLLFLSSRVLNRELSNVEKIFIRNLVRTTINPGQS